VLGLAAVLAGQGKGLRMGIVLSGADVDLQALAPLFAEAASGRGPAR
jgi:hypothetical protein